MSDPNYEEIIKWLKIETSFCCLAAPHKRQMKTWNKKLCLETLHMSGRRMPNLQPPASKLIKDFTMPSHIFPINFSPLLTQGNVRWLCFCPWFVLTGGDLVCQELLRNDHILSHKRCCFLDNVNLYSLKCSRKTSYLLHGHYLLWICWVCLSALRNSMTWHFIYWLFSMDKGSYWGTKVRGKTSELWMKEKQQRVSSKDKGLDCLSTWWCIWSDVSQDDARLTIASLLQEKKPSNPRTLRCTHRNKHSASVVPFADQPPTCWTQSRDKMDLGGLSFFVFLKQNVNNTGCPGECSN